MSNLNRGRSLIRPERHIEEKPLIPPPKDQHSSPPWKFFSRLVSFWAPPPVLSLMGIKEKGKQQAWREKFALVFIIAFLCGIVVFLTMFLSDVFCPSDSLNFRDNIEPITTPNTVSIEGFLFNTTNAQFPSDLPQFDDGEDITSFFLHGQNVPACNAPNVAQFQAASFDPCSSDNGNNGCQFDNISEAASDLGLTNVVSKDNPEPDIRKYAGYDWEDINEGFLVIDGEVYNFTPYLNAFPDPIENDELDELIRVITDKRRSDATKNILHREDLEASIDCLRGKYFAGRLLVRTYGCIGVQLFLLTSLIVIVSIIMIRFIMAVYFNWFISDRLSKVPRHFKDGTIAPSPLATWAPKAGDPMMKLAQSNPSELYTCLLVTCYSEGEDSIRGTVESLAATHYTDERKVLFIVADGIITGSENDRSTPDICIDLIEPLPEFQNPEPKSYIAIAAGAKQHNMAKVYAGHFNHNGHRVPTIIVVKCGTPAEQDKPKAGNRGKRDSQIILMNFFSRVIHNDRMTPLDYDLFKKITTLVGVTPDFFEIVLMVDADTRVEPESLSLLINCCQNDTRIMGLCGETRIANKRDSWVTKIQVFEYYISHHLGKGFESIFGGVTCLPGCFCMYRLKARKGDNQWVPVLTKPEIIQQYSQNEVVTLHEKNLLLLGEDRFLTTLMLKTFPHRKMMFLPQARCRTVVPDTFKILLSQRRRWINSTIHNLLELVLVRNLCGTFCFSMQFVIFMELIGTVVLPVAIIMTFVLIVNVILNFDPANSQSYIPLALLFLVLFLPAVLIAITTRHMVYIAWMSIYLLALPVWNFLLPVYAYWHFDDFSWGETRKVAGEAKGDDHGKKEGESDVASIPMKRWHEWHRREKKLGQRGNWDNNVSESDLASQQSHPSFMNSSRSQGPLLSNDQPSYSQESPSYRY